MAIPAAAGLPIVPVTGPDRKNRDTTHLLGSVNSSKVVNRVDAIRGSLPDNIYSFFAEVGEKEDFSYPIYFTQTMEVLRNSSPRIVPTLVEGVSVIEYDGYETVEGQKGSAHFFVTTLRIEKFKPWEAIFAKYPNFPAPKEVGGEDTPIVTLKIHEPHIREPNYHFYVYGEKKEMEEVSKAGLKAFYEMRAYKDFFNRYKEEIYKPDSDAQKLYRSLTYSLPEGKLYADSEYETFERPGKDWKLVKSESFLTRIIHETAARVIESKTGPQGLYVEGDNYEKENKHKMLLQGNLPQAVWNWLSPYDSDIDSGPQVYKYAPKASVGNKAPEAIESHVYVHMTKCTADKYVPLKRFFDTVLKDEKYKLYVPHSISGVKHLVEVISYKQDGTKTSDLWTSGQRVLESTDEGYKAYLDMRALRLLKNHPDFKPGSDAEQAYNIIVSELNKEREAGRKLSDIEAYNRPFDSSQLPEHVWTSGFNRFIVAWTDPLHIFHKNI